MAGICIAAALLAVSVFPLRLWRHVVSIEGNGKPIVMSEAVDTTKTVSQVFTAAYDRLKYIDVYVADLSGGRYLEAELQSGDGIVEFRRIIDLDGMTFPGYVRVNAGVALKVGLQYRLYLKGKLSSFRLGLEPVADNPNPHMGMFFHEDDPRLSQRLQMAAGYDVPLAKGRSLLTMAALCALAALLCVPVRTWYGRHPEKDRLLLLSVLTERTLYVITGAFYLALFLFNFPMKKFHDEPGEIAFLAAGIAIAAFVTFYAIRRICTEAERAEKMALKDIAAAVLFALAIAYACEYMNGEYNLMHSASERQLLACLLAVILLSFRTDMLVNRVNVVWALVSGTGAVWYVLRYALHAQTKQEAYQNTVLRFNALIIMLGGLVLISAARSIRARVWKARPLSRFGFLTLAMIVCLIVFDGTRMTGVLLLVLCTVLYVCVGCNIPDARFMRILVWGVNINFLLTVGYCLLFRAYQAFIFTRYGMVFPTVAITGEYLASVTLIAAAQFLLRLSKAADTLPLQKRILYAWRELLLFALAGVYAFLTISRTAYLTVFAGLFVLLAVYCTVHILSREGLRPVPFFKRFLTCGCVMLVSCALLFPGVFAMQRILPAVTGRHRVITHLEEEHMMHDLQGQASWDSTYYISGLRFWSIFQARILRQPELIYLRAEDRYNYDAYIRPLYTEQGEPIDWEAEDQSAGETEQNEPVSAFATVREGTGENTVDISNGRLDIFRTYLSRLSFRGHGVLYTENPDYIHAHNSYLQVMYTNGIPAGVLFSVWTFVAAVLPLVLYDRSVRHRREGEETGDVYLVTSAASLAFATAALTEMNFQLCNPMCFLLFTGVVPLIFKKEGAS